MKLKKFPFIFLLLFLSFQLFSQDAGWYVGVNTGTNLFATRGQSVFTTSFSLNPGYSTGISLERYSSGLFSFHTGLQFENLSEKMRDIVFTDENGNPIGSSFFQSNYQYLKVPLYLQLNFGKQVGFFVNTGAYSSFLLKQTSYTGISAGPLSEIINETDQFSKLDWGIQVGGGINIPFNRFLLGFEIRQHIGLEEIDRTLSSQVITIQTSAFHALVKLAYKI